MQASRRHASTICIFCRHARPSAIIKTQAHGSRSIYIPPQVDPRPSKRSVFLDGDDFADNKKPARVKGRSPGSSHNNYNLNFGKGRRRDDESGSRREERRDNDGARGGGPGRGRRGRAPQFSFKEVLEMRLKAMRIELKDSPIVEVLERDGKKFSRAWFDFTTKLNGVNKRSLFNKEERHNEENMIFTDLKQAFREKGEGYLDSRIKYAFYGQIAGAHFTESDIRNQQALADLRYPSEWYPATRQMRRVIHMHVGPTNSGKTYHALKRLEAASTGIYAGPLRLLAHEVFTRLNANGKRCVLVTGEERRTPDESMSTEMSSCTVEMMPMNKNVEVAVIDEIQMIGNADRGWAWTQALLSVKAKEVHLCGEARTVPLIREICASIGEKVIVHEYERLSPLRMEDASLAGDFSKLRKGDCIVSFSVVGIHSLRQQIEEKTGKKVATVYGSLPPETRAQQARLFNEPDNDYDFLVASDAVGMGLNLSIKRVIFEESHKFDGYQRRALPIADIKQIAGRAGRYRSANLSQTATTQPLSNVKGESQEDTATEKVETMSPVTNEDASNKETDHRSPFVLSNIDKAQQGDGSSPSGAMSTRAPLDTKSYGLVTTLEKFDYPLVAKALESEPSPIKTAGLFPPASVVERFAQYFPPGTPFSYILLRLHELSQMHPRFHLCGLKDQLNSADLIESVKDLTVADRIILCAVPASKGDAELFKYLLPALARCVEQQGGGSLLDIEEMPLETLELEISASRLYLRQLEQLHKGIIAYLWLSYRFAGIFTSRILAFHVKSLVEAKIERVLSEFSFSEENRRQVRKRREKEAVEDMQKQLMLEEEAEAEAQYDGQAKPRRDSRADVANDQTSVIAGGDSFGGEEDIHVLDEDEPRSRDVDPRRADDNGNISFTAERDSPATETEDDFPDPLTAGEGQSDTQNGDSTARAEAGISKVEPTVDDQSGITAEDDSADKPLKTQIEPPVETEGDENEAQRKEGHM